MSETVRYEPRSQIRELASASAKDLYRDRKGSFSILFMFFFFLLLIVGLNFVINIGGRVTPVVAVDSSVVSSQEVLDRLEASGIESAAPASANVVIAEADGVVQIILDENAKPQWLQVAAAVERAGYATDKYVVVDTAGDGFLDLLRANLPALSCIGLMAIAFMGTSVPLTRMRENGTLRLLGTTPVSKMAFIVAQTPVRLVFGLFVIITIFVTAWVLGYTSPWQLTRLIVTMGIGLIMFFALAYLLASRTRRADSVNNFAAVLPVLAMFASGSVLPPQLIPEPVQWVLNALPTTWYTRAAAADLIGDQQSSDLMWLYWGLMLVTTVISGLLAAKLFVWDDRER